MHIMQDASCMMCALRVGRPFSCVASCNTSRSMARHELVLCCMFRGDVARFGRTALIGRVRHCCVCSPHVAQGIYSGFCMLRIVPSMLHRAHGMAVCRMHAACVLPHAWYALHGASAAPRTCAAVHCRRACTPQVIECTACSRMCNMQRSPD